MCKQTQQLSTLLDIGVQTDTTTPNNTQQHATGCANGRNM